MYGFVDCADMAGDHLGHKFPISFLAHSPQQRRCMDPNELTVAGGEDVVVGGGQDSGCLSVVNHVVQDECVFWIEKCVCYGQKKREEKKRKKIRTFPHRFK